MGAVVPYPSMLEPYVGLGLHGESLIDKEIAPRAVCDEVPCPTMRCTPSHTRRHDQRQRHLRWTGPRSGRKCLPISCAMVSVRLWSPTTRVGVTNVSRGFSMPTSQHQQPGTMCHRHNEKSTGHHRRRASLSHGCITGHTASGNASPPNGKPGGMTQRSYTSQRYGPNSSSPTATTQTKWLLMFHVSTSPSPHHSLN
jgi:hypothetical protein